MIKIFIEQQVKNNTQARLRQRDVECFAIQSKIDYTIINPKKKFKDLNIQNDKINTYVKRKKASVEYVKNNIETIFDDSNENKNLFLNLNKKDDISDCILMFLTSCKNLNQV